MLDYWSILHRLVKSNVICTDDRNIKYLLFSSFIAIQSILSCLISYLYILSSHFLELSFYKLVNVSFFLYQEFSIVLWAHSKLLPISSQFILISLKSKMSKNCINTLSKASIVTVPQLKLKFLIEYSLIKEYFLLESSVLVQ